MSAPNSGKKSFSPHIIPKTKGLEESLALLLMPDLDEKSCLLLLPDGFLCLATL